MSDRVRIDLTNGVADVRLNRADKLNSLDPAMFEALVAAGRSLAEDRSVRAVVLSGEGRAFCAGLDFQSFASFAESARADAVLGGDADEEGTNGGGRVRDAIANEAQMAAWVWHELPVPVIAAVHGFAYGGGLQIALGADLRIVAPDAKLSVREIEWGLIPDMTGPQTLRHLVRLDIVKELTYTGRIVGGREAVEIGLATRLSDDPHTTAMELATEIAGRSPHAIRSAKRVLDASAVSSVADGLALEERLQVELIGSPNQVEAVRANFEKRPPAFADPE